MKKKAAWDFPSGPVVKNLPANAGDIGLFPGPRRSIPHVSKQLRARATSIEPVFQKVGTTIN